MVWTADFRHYSDGQVVFCPSRLAIEYVLVSGNFTTRLLPVIFGLCPATIDKCFFGSSQENGGLMAHFTCLTDFTQIAHPQIRGLNNAKFTCFPMTPVNEGLYLSMVAGHKGFTQFITNTWISILWALTIGSAFLGCGIALLFAVINEAYILFLLAPIAAALFLLFMRMAFELEIIVFRMETRLRTIEKNSEQMPLIEEHLRAIRKHYENK